ncbi:MAG: ABC transporter ATP-binding protein [Acidimicrobiia bacterium]
MNDSASEPSPDASGGDEPVTPFRYDEVFKPRADKPMRELPRLIRSAVALVWTAGRRNTKIVVTITMIQALLTVAQLLLIRRLLGELADVSNGAEVRTMVPELAAFVGVFTAQGMVGLIDGQVRQVLGDQVARHATSLVAKAAAGADLLEFERPGFHDRLQRSLANASVRPLQTAYAVIGIASAVLTSVAVAITLATIQPLLLAMLVVAFGPLWIVTRRLTRMGFEWTVAESQADRRRSYFLMLLTQKEMAKELRAYQLAPEINSRFGSLWDSRLERLQRLTARRIKLGLIGRVVNGLMLGAVLAVLAWMVSSGRADVAQAGVAAGAVVLLGQRLGALMGSVGQLYECGLFLHDVESFLAERREHETSRPTAAMPGPLRELRAEAVGFTYPAGRGAALSDVSVSVRPGEMIALVGVNGSGKTTLAKVLAGLFPPSEGTVRWNDEDLTPVDPELWRGQVAVVFQDFARYLLSMAENIGFGRVQQTPDDASLRAAATAAGALDLVDSLPQQWETLLGPEFFGGSDLSGGQWQRIALARAFYRDAPVVILDEPSSALDPEAEAALFDRVKELGDGRAVVVISHRFSTVTRADRIYVMEAGRVIESGSHAELVARGGEYARLFTLQAKQYGTVGT